MKIRTLVLFIVIATLLPVALCAGTCGLLGDSNSDGKIGLEEAIYALQTVSGIKVDYPDEMILFYTFYKEECPDYYVGNIYLYNTATGMSDTVKDNCLDANGASVNPESTMIAYAEGTGEDAPRTIKTYDIASKTISTIDNVTANGNVSFDKNGKVLYIDYNTGVFKKMNTDGTDIIQVTQPDSPYVFSMFWVSPDYQQVGIVEEYQGHSKLLLMNADGTDRKVIIDDYVGSWNQMAWKTDSSGFFYFYHIYGNSDEIHKYLLADTSGDSVKTTDISDSDLGRKKENVCFATESGNFISLTYREMYNEQGEWIADKACYIPLLTKGGMFGFGKSAVYFADFADGNIINIRMITD